jgi:hypothetical protein
MSSGKRTALAIAVIGALVLFDVCLRLGSLRGDAFTKRFSIVNVQTNDTKASMIVDRHTGKPVWGEWDLGHGGRPDCVSYFYEGRNVMNFYPRAGEPARFDVTLYGEDGKVRTVWGSRGINAGFTERERYDTGIPRREIWFNEAWHTLQHRTNDGLIQGGIVLDGKWQHVEFTNGVTVVAP